MRPLGAFLVLALALLPASVHAATVERLPGGTVDDERVDIVRVKAAAGEVNAVTVTVKLDGAYTVTTVRDESAPLTIVRGCRATDSRTVRCRGRNDLGQVDVKLGDGDDAATVGSDPADHRLYYLTTIAGGDGNDDIDVDDGGDEVSGGAGNDRLRGSRLYDSLDGGPGDDELLGRAHGDFLEGGPGDDILQGGAGNDDLLGGSLDAGSDAAGNDQLYGEDGSDNLDDSDVDSDTPAVGPDTLDGGNGEDTVDSYRRRTAPVQVNLGEATGAGEAGENDSLTGFETVIGGDGDDTLLGDDGPNWLDGRDGEDTVRGLGGADLLFAWDSDDVGGGGGADDIRTVPEFTGTLSCDAGRDTVRIDVFLSKPRNLAGPLIEPACERLTNGSSFAIDPIPGVGSDGRLTFRVFKYRSSKLRLFVTQPTDPFRVLRSKPIRSKRVSMQMPSGLADRADLRTLVRPLGAAPFAWRFSISP